jgi:hypothetical protein
MSELEGLGSTFDLQVGRHIALHGSFRMSSTGLITSGIAAAVILLASAILLPPCDGGSIKATETRVRTGPIQRRGPARQAIGRWDDDER